MDERIVLIGWCPQLFMADTESKFSEKIGWVIPESGGRAARYAIVIDHGKVVYAEKEAGREIKVRATSHQLSSERWTMLTQVQASSAETILSKI